MQSRKAKNWCRVCKDEMREEMRIRHLHALQSMMNTQHIEQDMIFNEERHQVPPDTPPPEDPEEPIDQELINEMQEMLIEQVLEQNRVANPQVQFRVAELFLNVDERTIIDFIQRLDEANNGNEQIRTTNGVVHQLVQRLRLCLHPDKNREHPRAAEAFARM